ncbi:MAG: NAD(P)H-dependent oxidoreductase subunit E [Bacteroidales bacterium]|nr:NAD(P)H-dependent oxidoreductase subunit E [Bacteroidales bacterium]
MKTNVNSIIGKYNNDKTRLMDILIDIQAENGFIPSETIDEVAGLLCISKVDVEQTLSFYHFFTDKPRGEYQVYLNNSAVANMMGRAEIAKTFEEEVGNRFDAANQNGKIGLYSTACIGMNDQEPSAIINGKVFTQLTADKVKAIVADMKAGKAIEEMNNEYGDGQNASELVKSMVLNNIRKRGKVLFSEYNPAEGLKKALAMTPEEVIEEVKKSTIRGRGGAGFPTGLKWDFCRRSEGEAHYVLCNADEGEPGTFKERVLLTEYPQLIFEGMTIAGYAIGANEGILYLRSEYVYLKEYLEHILQKLRDENLLGNNIAGKDGFNYDIRIQFGAGAYVCGEESALIESAEGKRGEPRNRPPFPVQKGYLDQPTVINNVETLCSVVKIIQKGGDWFTMMGSKESAGTKLLSISGDCKYPGVYEIEWGTRVRDVLELAGADDDIQAVQIGGPSGACVSSKDFKRNISFEDLPTGGSLIIIGKERNLLKDIVANFTDFFIEESCGSCVPCRALTVIMKNKLDKILAGKGVQSDLADLENWGAKMKIANRCGLGQTAANPILTTLKNFREKYEELLIKDREFETGFDLEAAVAESCEVVGRTPNL